MLARITMFAACLLAVAVAAQPAHAGCLKCRIKGYVNAINERDMDKALDYFADEVRFVAPKSTTVLDRAELEGMLGWDFATEAALSYSDLEWEGEIVDALITEKNRFYELLGIPERQYRVQFRFEGERIREVSLSPVADEAPLDDALAPFLSWAEKRHGGVLDQIYPDGKMVYRPDAAKQWLTLLQQWRAG